MAGVVWKGKLELTVGFETYVLDQPMHTTSITTARIGFRNVGTGELLAVFANAPTTF
jgi:hypothetical protein